MRLPKCGPARIVALAAVLRMLAALERVGEWIGPVGNQRLVAPSLVGREFNSDRGISDLNSSCAINAFQLDRRSTFEQS